MKDIYRHMANTLKSLREAQGWSLDKAAEATGVSKAMLGQIEREESSPTIATLWKIAKGFQTSFSIFIEEEQNPRQKYQSGGIQVTTLFPYDAKVQFEIFCLELAPKCEHLSEPHATGIIEHIVVTQGSIEVFTSGRWKRLKTGETLRFNADELHGYRNHTGKTAVFHNIIHYPSATTHKSLRKKQF